MILSFLVPTYNRCDALLLTVSHLAKIIIDLEKEKICEIIVSDNNSVDKTSEYVRNIIEKYPSISIRYVKQNENIGLENNTLKTLELAKGQNVMFFGDDDFCNKEYLDVVFKHIVEKKDTYSIIPNFTPIDIHGNVLDRSRDHNVSTSIYPSGFSNCLMNSWRGHQLSGLLLKREGLLDAYKKRKVQNIYPFIFFVAFNCLRGNTLHLVDYPILVTQVAQNKKDWGYNKDGLLNEIFDNYKKLPLSAFKITRLQIQQYYKQPWRLWRYKQLGIKSYLSSFWSIMFCKNSTFLFTCCFPLVEFYLNIKVKMKSK